MTQVSVLDGGREVSNERIQTTPSALRKLAATLRAGDEVVLEATVNTWPVADLLRQHGGHVVVSNPLRIRAIASAKVKSDKVDSRVLAELLAADYIPEVWVPDEAHAGRMIAAYTASAPQRQMNRDALAVLATDPTALVKVQMSVVVNGHDVLSNSEAQSLWHEVHRIDGNDDRQELPSAYWDDPVDLAALREEMLTVVHGSDNHELELLAAYVISAIDGELDKSGE